MTPRSRAWAVNLALLGGSLLVALAIGEAVLRTLRPSLVRIQRQPAIYLPDEVIGSRYAPNAEGRLQRAYEVDSLVRTNSLGFHDTEHPGAAEAGCTAAIGDSFTAGLEVEVAQEWTQVLQRRLREGGLPWAEVVNLGVDNSGTDVHLAVLERHLELLRPRAVILAFYENDLEDFLRAPFYREARDDGFILFYQDPGQRRRLAEFIDRHRPWPLSIWFADRLFLFRALLYLKGGERHLYLNNYVVPSLIGEKPHWEGEARREADFEPLFQRLADLPEEHGFLPLVIPVPVKGKPQGSWNMLRRHLSPPTWDRLTVVDVLPAMQRLMSQEGATPVALYWKIDGHFNAHGHQIFGLAVTEVAGDALRGTCARRRRGGREGKRIQRSADSLGEFPPCQASSYFDNGLWKRARILKCTFKIGGSIGRSIRSAMPAARASAFPSLGRNLRRHHPPAPRSGAARAGVT